MYIENPEALKAWLSNILKPLCEADPSALAKYVLALAKKDKTEEELRASMISQLDVFLQKETIHFVDTLFIALETKSYIPPVLGTESVVPENAQNLEFAQEVQKSPHVGYSIDGPVGRPEVHIKRSESDREDGRRGRKRTRSRGSSRSSSRSRSPRDKFRRSRSISNDRAKIGRPSRSRRSPRRTVYRRRTPVYRRSRSASRRSPARRSRSPLRVRARTRSPDRRRDERSVTGAAIPLPLDVTIPPPPLPPGKQRCRDFDEKGFCMLGELCPFDHGIDPVVVDDTELPRVLNFTGPLPEIPPPLHVSHVAPPPPPTVAVEPYNPDVPAISWPRPGYPPLMAPLPYQPTMRPTAHRPYIRRNMTTPVQAVVPAGSVVREIRPIKVDAETEESVGTVMAEARQRRMGARNPNNCSLELRKVPRGLNNISQLNQHFSKFGRIVNLQIMYGGDPEAAVVTFSNHGEALAAYRSSEAVMNNRFVKVFWHNADKQENIPPSLGSTQRSLKDRLGPVPHDQEVMDYEEDKIQSTTFVNKEVLAKQQEHQKAQELESIKQAQALLAAQEAMRKKQEEKKKEAAKLQLDIVKRKQDLLEKQIEQQKILLAKLEKGGKTMKRDERETLVKTIKTVQESIESLKKEISAPLKRNLEDIQKELFQAEVELQSRLMAPAEYAVAKQRLVGLRQELVAVGGATVRGKPAIRARGGRGGFIGPKISLDRRTTKLLVSGFKEEDTGDVLAFLAQYGEIVSHMSAEPTDLIVEYKYRYEAETALKEIVNQEFLDTKLRVKWHPTPPALKEQVPVSNTVKETRSEKLMDLTEAPNDELLDYDNEEMEELSWKR